MRILAKFLSAEISPLVYLLMGMSLFIGLCFVSGFLVETSVSVLYDTGVLVNREVWGIILTMTASIALYGFAKGNDSLVSLGGIGGFTAWLFAAIELAAAMQWYVFATIALLHLLFHIYVVLSSATHRLRRVY